MASIRKHPRSPYWYLRRRDLDTQEWVEESTGLRYDNHADTRKAQRLAEAATIDEKRIGGPRSSSAFVAWVPEYMRTHWTRKTDSPKRYGIAWDSIKAFLIHAKIVHPRQVKYEHGQQYVDWRLKTKVHKRTVGHNTARLELKFLSQLMNEASKRKFTENNPLAEYDIPRTAGKVKPELSDADIEKLRTGLKDEEEWMRVAFEIAIYTGCRFSECSIPMEDVNLDAGTIRLQDAKRNETDDRKFFTVPIHPKLLPTLKKLKDDGATRTCHLGLENGRETNSRVNYLFRRLGINASFHSLRVTFVTRCHRGGLSESEAMRLVNHSSQLAIGPKSSCRGNGTPGALNEFTRFTPRPKCLAIKLRILKSLVAHSPTPGAVMNGANSR